MRLVEILATAALVATACGCAKTHAEEEPAAAYRTVWVPAPPAADGRETVDGSGFARSMADAMSALGAQGFEVIAITPVQRGQIVDRANRATASFGLTQGAVITARRSGGAR